MINLDKTSKWEYIKRKSLWVHEQINDTKHLSFSFKTQSLNDLLHFSINLIGGDNKSIKLSSGEQAF